jgi:hypothetical protein
MRGCSKKKVKEKKIEKEYLTDQFTKKMTAYELRIDRRQIFTCFEVTDERQIEKRKPRVATKLCPYFSVDPDN